MNSFQVRLWPFAATALASLLAWSCSKSEGRAETAWSELWAFGGESVSVPADTEIKVRLEQSLDSEISAAGDRFEATLAAPLSAEGKLLALAGAPVWGELIAVGERITMTLRGMKVAGESHVLETEPLTLDGGTRGKLLAFRPGAIFRFALREPIELPVLDES